MAHRLALDHADKVTKISLLDIVDRAKRRKAHSFERSKIGIPTIVKCRMNMGSSSYRNVGPVVHAH